MGRYIVGVTGASGSVLAASLMRELLLRGHELFVTATAAGILVLKQELNLDLSAMAGADQARAIAAYLGVSGSLTYFDEREIGAPIASGSFKTDGMAVVPCTMGTAHAIAYGASGNLLERAADVMIKEKRRLVVVPRETPLSAIHLQNLLQLAQNGVTVLPPMPAFYAHPQTVDEMVINFTGRLLDQLGVENDLAYVYTGL